MAYVVSTAASQEPGASATFEMANPTDIQVGDYLVSIVSRDGTPTTNTSNWTVPANGEVQLGSIRMSLAYHRVTSLPPPRCTWTGSSEEWTGVVFCVRDAYYDSADADFIDIVGNGNDAAGPPYTLPGLAVNYPNSLILFGIGVDNAVNPAPSTGGVVVVDTQDAAAVSFLGGWYMEPTDTAADSIDFVGTLTTNSLVFMQIAIRNATNGRVGVCPAIGTHDLIDTGYHRERAAAFTNETNTNNFRGWDVRDPGYVFLDDGGVFTNLTTAATNDTDADVAYPTTEAIGDALYIGSSTLFSSLVVDRAGCTAGVAGVFAVEYWNGSAWVAVPKKLDTTTNFTATVGDNQVINWRTPSNHATTTVNGQSAYWVRLRITTVYTTNPTVSRIRIAEAGLIYDAWAAVGDTGVSPFWSSGAVSPANTHIGGHVGAVRDLGTTIDLDAPGRYLMGTYIFTSPREYYDTGDAALGYGVRFPLLDASNNYRSWMIGGYAYPQCRGDVRNIWAAQPSQSVATHHGQSSTAPNFNSARKWVVCQGSYADEVTQIYHSMMVYVNNLTLYGGTSGGPATWSDVQVAMNGTVFPYFTGGKIYAPLVFGGTKALHVDIELATMDFIRVAKSTYGGMIHVDEDVLGVVIDASDGDTIKIRNSTITSESRIRFEIASGTSLTATYDFTGLTIVNASVTLRALELSNMNFIACPSFTQNGATLDSCSFSDTKVTSASLGDMALISNSAFSSSGTGHAIEVGGTATTVTLNGVTFTGYAGSSGSTGNEAIYVNIASGTVTINIAGGGSTPSIRTAGATVNVVSGATVTFTGLPTGCDIVILTAGTDTILQQVDQHSGTSYAWAYQGTPTVDVGFIKPGYRLYYIRGLTLSTSDSSIPVTLTADRNYS